MAVPREFVGTATAEVFDEDVVYPHLDGGGIAVAISVGAIDLKPDPYGIRRVVNAITGVGANIRGVVLYDEVRLGSH